jgi:hypothetical protein
MKNENESQSVVRDLFVLHHLAMIAERLIWWLHSFTLRPSAVIAIRITRRDWCVAREADIAAVFTERIVWWDSFSAFQAGAEGIHNRITIEYKIIRTKEYGIRIGPVGHGRPAPLYTPVGHGRPTGLYKPHGHGRPTGMYADQLVMGDQLLGHRRPARQFSWSSATSSFSGV